ncbi:mRNA export factor [Nematocida ausubeli]|uniref:Anaphase-promoting complex subunit 4 WD40 domain-containing protein n=1 Tax=Nematocida ausubeli (strain ATCC PRA-371 / ERTm2) TaxID=1913371 RepID=A0A086J050_NEMA1|nr:uncharacterized protein NESG_02294 [Nematocida ausubeli]KAI5133087.1 mRNA export factor [Nematocida ausubeli]KAI5161459.1 mRNA export factor [Nematocida ausubeli]KFG25518.1 hypothetical protein NESG_02294 [Nematocida ausubeli]
MYNPTTTTSMQGNKEVLLSDFLVQQPPTDSISSIKYSPVSDILTACSWDGSVYIYMPSNQNVHESMALKTSIPNPNGSPILCSCFSSDGMYLFTGSADGAVRVIDMGTGNLTTLGRHSLGVSAMVFTCARTLVTGSWDKTVKVWDINNPQAQPKELLMEDKVYAMDSKMNTIAILLSNTIVSYDAYTLEKVQVPTNSAYQNKLRPSTPMGYGTIQTATKYQLKSQWQLRSISCSNDGQDAIVGTTGSKAEIVAVRPGNSLSTMYYSFRCKQTTTDRNAYPINSVHYHPAFPMTLLTAGTDGVVMLWNRQAKCRVAIGGPGASSVSSVIDKCITATAFNNTGRYLAVAVGYDWSQGFKSQISTPVEIRILMIPEEIHSKTGMRI